MVTGRCDKIDGCKGKELLEMMSKIEKRGSTVPSTFEAGCDDKHYVLGVDGKQHLVRIGDLGEANMFASQSYLCHSPNGNYKNCPCYK